MDERELTELFRAAADTAARNAPPPSFDHTDIVERARQAQQRRRRIVVVSLATVGLMAVGLVGAHLGSARSNFSSTLAEPAPASAEAAPPRPAPFLAPPPPAPPDEPARPEATTPGGGSAAVTPTPSQQMPFEGAQRAVPTSCATPDLELFAQVTALLPAARGATPRPLSDPNCPPGSRGVELDITESGTRGVLRVLRIPPGSSGGGQPPNEAGTTVASGSATTPEGGVVSVTVLSSGPGPAPFAGRLDQLASQLAQR